MRVKVMTILGTRPEIIRLSRVIPKLDELCDHVLLHTGQNFDVNLNEIFFQQLGVRQPDHFLNARGTFGEQIGAILSGAERVLVKERPDRFLVLGDTNSSLAAIIVKRNGIPVYHMEAGNRCYDDRVPEEVNRRIIDHSSDVLMPYTQRSRQNLLSEGIPGHRIFVTGNPIYEVLRHYDNGIATSRVFDWLGVQPGKYFLVTMHRAENVDIPARLQSLTEALARVQTEHSMPVIVSTHPRTRLRMQTFNIASSNSQLRFLDPFGFFDFVNLERNAYCVLSDSGTVQEECSIFQVPCVTIRDTTERPETLECANNILSGAGVNSVRHSVRVVVGRSRGCGTPQEYLYPNVSSTVCQIVLGYLHCGGHQPNTRFSEPATSDKVGDNTCA
jgi:UDP-N-acetylglucosamine 2-epimerase (non-hydrolysing)